MCLVGLFLFGVGFLHRVEKIDRLDGQGVRHLHRFLNAKVGVTVFQRLWFLGRTPFTLLWLGFLIGLNWRYGLAAGGIFGLAAGLEGGIKLLLARTRPFRAFPEEVDMLQPQTPTDFSFPSGDCMRVWFLALVLPAFWGFPWLFFTLLAGLALVVTLGRVAMGVHYPLDVVSGAGLGMLGAGLTLLTWAGF